MKNLTLTIAILIGTLTSFAGNNKNDNAGCLEMSLHITYEKKMPKGTKVEVFDGSTIVYSSVKPEYFYFFKFWLQRDREYTIVISSEGFHSQKFLVNTYMPASIAQKIAYQILKQIEMVPSIVGYDPQSMHLPDEKISFCMENNLFSHDLNYSASVRAARLNMIAQAFPVDRNAFDWK